MRCALVCAQGDMWVVSHQQVLLDISQAPARSALNDPS